MARMIAERGDALPGLAEVFREYGYVGASLSLIGTATGLGRGSLYHFFPGGKQEMAAAVLADHLVALGHRRIATITGPLSFYSASEREQGFRAALEVHGIELPDRYVVEGDYGFAAGYAKANQLLALADPPTAIFGGNDITAAGVLKAALERGISVPHELSVVGFDDSDIASMISPTLTTIRRPLLSMAREATERLIRMIGNGDKRRLPDHRIPLTLVERQSSGPAPAG